MFRDWLDDLVWLEAVHARLVRGDGWFGLQELQQELIVGLNGLRELFSLSAREPREAEPMPAAALLDRKRQAAALVDTLLAAAQPQGSSLAATLAYLRGIVAEQIRLLGAEATPERQGDWWLAEGYRLEKVLGGLVFPTSLEFDDRGCLYVLEGGFSYLTTEATARLLRLDPDGPSEVARDFRGPATSLTWHAGAFYIAEGGPDGLITRLRPDGRARTTVVGDLHTGGDHFTTDLVFGPDGAMYFGVGTATNSAVVGLDNLLSWGTIRPRFHDVPARDLRLRGVNFPVPKPTGKPGETALTGAFKPLGEASRPGEIIRGQLRAGGVIYRAAPDGSDLKVYADGLRNPFGLGFIADGRLLAANQGLDARGQRPIANDWESIWEIKAGGWYGWPDYASGLPVTLARFRPAGKPAPDFLLAEHPPLAGQPLARLAPHSGTCKFATAPGGRFGYGGQLFMAQVGDFSPMSQALTEHRGFRVVRLNLATGQAADFYVNHRPNAGGSGPERPVAVKFAPDGECLYVLDFGVLRTYPMTMSPKAGTGALWRIIRAV